MTEGSKPENTKKGPLAGISRNTLLLGLVSFFNDLSSDMIHPHLLAVFLQSVLHASTASIGLIGGVAESTASLMKPLSGWFSDVVRRRRPGILLGYWLAAVSRPLLALSGAAWQVLGLRFADRLGKGARTALRDALIADSTPQRYRGKAFGLHRALDASGAALGMLIAALVLWMLADAELSVSLRTVFVVAAVPGIVVVGLVVWGVREQRDTGREQAAPPAFSRAKQALTPGLMKWYGIVFVFWLGNSSNMFLILKARKLEVAVWQVPLLVFAMSVVQAGLSTTTGSLSDRVGRRGVILSGWILYSLIYVGFAFAGARWMMFALFAGYGLYYALTEGVERALVADLAPRAARATALGLYHFVVGAAALPASIICGLLWSWDRLDPHGPRFALGFGAACALLASLLFLILKPRPTGRVALA